MAKNENKTQPTDVSPADFIASVEHDRRREDAEVLLKWFEDVTGYAPKMWGSSLIGYGRYHYKYDSGREGDMLVTGFSPRKANLVMYIMPGYRDMGEKLARLSLRDPATVSVHVANVLATARIIIFFAARFSRTR